MTDNSHFGIDDIDTDGVDMSRDEDVETEEGEYWQDLFPYDEPYEQQKDGIKQLIAKFKDDQIVSAEGPCGTGKTLLALSAALELVRDPDSRFRNIFVATSVRQQLRAFEEDLRLINQNTDSRPVRSLSLVGKASMCSYVDAGVIDEKEIYNTCSDLQQRTRMENQGVQELMGVEKRHDSNPKLEKEGEWESKYLDQHPGDMDGQCPFYANHLRKELQDETFEFDGVYTPWELKNKASNQNRCPHATMTSLIGKAEVILANYRHIFDPLTSQTIIEEHVGENTIFIGDEAHSMIDIVRDVSSFSLAEYTLSTSIRNIDRFLLDPDTASERRIANDVEDTLKSDLRNYGNVFKYKEFLETLREFMLEKADMIYNPRKRDEDEIEYELRNPEKVGEDELTKFIKREYDIDQLEESEFSRIISIGGDVADAIADARPEQFVDTHNDTITLFFRNWISKDNVDNYRNIELKKRENNRRNYDYNWEQTHTLSLNLKNCIPTERVTDVVGEFGTGIFMSATLEPLDVFNEVVGLTKFDRKTDTIRFEPSFPEENRESLVVDLPKFTSDNRGNPNEAPTKTRREYGEAIKNFVQSVEGNTMIATPSYAEAEWAGNVINDIRHSFANVIVDESTTADVTEEKKEEFFSGGDKILVTTMRGTLTEGVDYDGDKLSNILVIGVPIPYVNDGFGKAKLTAYKERYGDWKGFKNGLAAPSVRKARQSIGRVIRGTEDVGTRVLLDTRYSDGYVRDMFPHSDISEYDTVSPKEMKKRLEDFWN